MENVNVKINNKSYSVPQGSTILEAARYAGIEIPTLCYLKKINEIGACRMCMVEVKGARSLVAACVFPVNEGMEIFTNTEKVRHSRKLTLELILSTHDKKCLSCVRSGNCELQQLCKEFGVDDINRYEGDVVHYNFDDSAAHMIRDNNKCILCRRCIAACDQQGISVIGANARGFDTHVSSAFDKDLADVSCISCGQCIVNCPTGAIVEKDDTDKALAAINDPDKFVIVHTAPSIRATLGEAFGMHIGTNVEGKMVAALRRLGFDKVFDTDFAADLTIMEEANELIERVQNGGVLPMITSCSPGWIKYCEHYYPEQIPHLSTCKSPQQMFGATMKTYYAEKMGIDPANMVVVGIMPCTAKKFETKRDNQAASGYPDVDIALTTRELARMIENAGIFFKHLPDEEFDTPFGESTGAATIFGTTGGVMEAALRTAVEKLTGKELENVDKDSCEYTSKQDIKNNMESEKNEISKILSTWNDSENPLMDTYTLKVKDVEQDAIIPEGKVVTLHLNKNVIYGTLTNYGTLSIFNGNVIQESAENTNAIINNGTLILGEDDGIISKDNIAIKRPGNGKSPMNYWDILGQNAAKDYMEDELI